MNRRDFFRPRQLAGAAGPILGALQSLQSPLEAPASPKRDDAAPLSLLRLGRRAMACDFEVLLPFGTPNGYEAGEEALDLIDRLEDQLSVFRETSEVSELNRL